MPTAGRSAEVHGAGAGGSGVEDTAGRSSPAPQQNAARGSGAGPSRKAGKAGVREECEDEGTWTDSG